MSNSTQNSFSDTMRSNTPEKAKIMSDAYDRGIEKAMKEGFAESEKDLKNKKTPFDKPTQNDWEKRFEQFVFENKYTTVVDPALLKEYDVKAFIRKELADARREVIADLFSNQDFLNNLKWTIQDHMNRAFKDFNEDYFIPGEMRDVGVVADRTVEAVLATLREEEQI